MGLNFVAIISLILSYAVALQQRKFLWGTATAAYQFEGAWKKDGKSPSIWDTFTHTPGKTNNGANGDVADDDYDRFQEDVDLMYGMGVNSYRFSLSWARILPDGVTPNPLGIAHYRKLLDALLLKNITPFVTLYHWDLPQIIYDQTNGGWINETIVDFFVRYAETCFEAFGSQVKHWLTFNEPSSFCLGGYFRGDHAPARCSNRTRCVEGNSSTEPYLCGHHVLLSHAHACNIYHREFASQKGQIGITLNGDWAEPMTPSQEDKDAAERSMVFYRAWWGDAIYFGDYPEMMRQAAGSRMPQFTTAQKALLKGSSDFYGMNEYSASWAANQVIHNITEHTWATDKHTVSTAINYNGTAIGDNSDTGLYVVPTAIKNVLLWVSKRYNNPPIYITENGVDCDGEGTMPLPQVLNDTCRPKFFAAYLANVQEARKQGADVRGYFPWSLMDNFEWFGYNARFGFLYIDRKNNLNRHPKDSYYWYKKYIEEHPY